MILPIISWSLGSWILDSLVVIIAGLGGVIVFVGLWMEGPPDENSFRNIDEFRRHKIRSNLGWRVLLVGIFIEVLVAVGIAIKDGWEIHQINKKTAKNDPRNQ